MHSGTEPVLQEYDVGSTFQNAPCLDKKKTKNVFGYFFVKPIEFGCE